MAFRNEGGNFSNDSITRLLANKMGSMSLGDLDKQEKIPRQAIDLSSGTLGTIGSSKFEGLNKIIGSSAEYPAEMGLADRIKQAVQNSNIKTIEGPADAGLAKFKQMAQDAPKDFFERNRLLESASSVPDQQLRQYQQNIRDQLLNKRNTDQIKQADQDKFQKLREVLFGPGSK